MGSELHDRCSALHDIIHGLKRHRFPVDTGRIPSNGMYFLFEAGEVGHSDDRIVRVGSHTGNANLAARLREHTTPKKDRSIFRKHIGRAILFKNRDPFLTDWNRDLTSRANKDKYAPLVDAASLAEVEQLVTACIEQNFSVSVIGTPDTRLALHLEARCIATIATCAGCFASPAWLGNSSPIPKIASGRLWQVQGLKGQPLSLEDLKIIENLAR
jgi:hypothetical protein